MKRNYLVCLTVFFIITGNASNVLAQKKKNLLFIITDQQRYDALSIAGNSVLKTPNLDRLAKMGAYFKNAYTPCAVCAPARSSILTGCTVEHHGVRTNDRAYYYNKERIMTMPTFDEILTDNGYHCEYYGKWHSQTSHTTIYKNPRLASKEGKSIFGPWRAKILFISIILMIHDPVRKPGAGEFYDKFTESPYKPNPLDVFYGEKYEDIKNSTKENHST